MSDELRLGLIIGSCTVLLLIIIFLLVRLKNKSKSKGTNEFPELLSALGGLENISNVKLNGSRVSLTFTNKDSIDKELVKQNGVESLVISNKKITMVIGKNAQKIYNYLQSNIEA